MLFTFDYGRRRIDTFLISTQHAEDASSEDVYSIVLLVMKDTAKRYSLNTDFKVLVNPTGRFVIGGSFADTGVTGRKSRYLRRCLQAWRRRLQWQRPHQG